jgi:peroxiredoxin
MTIKAGERLPQATFKEMTPDGVKPRTTDDVFKGRRVVLFAVPGAFTPTCHKNHLPGFRDNAEAIKAKGVDAIVVTSVNDPFVMGAWAKATEAQEKIIFLADPNADFAKAVGLDLDMSQGLGFSRSKRYSMIVEDGVVRTLNVEDTPGKADVSGADHLIKQL